MPDNHSPIPSAAAMLVHRRNALGADAAYAGARRCDADFPANQADRKDTAARHVQARPKPRLVRPQNYRDIHTLPARITPETCSAKANHPSP